MSDAHNEHESAIKTPKQLVIAIVAAFVVPIICIVLLVQYVTTDKLVGAGSQGQSPEAIAARIRPVADEGFNLKDANAPKVLQSGEAVYTSTCAACHGTGAAGAPKIGDTAGWSARIGQGYEILLKHALEGYHGVMPAKGGNPDLDDAEVARAVVYMANKAGGKFKEPEVKPATPAAVAAPTAAPAASVPAPAPAPSASASAAVAVVAAAPVADLGKKRFEESCQICHGAGIAGAPKFGDKAAWAPRIKQGAAVLYEHALKGFQGKSGVMPPKGASNAPDDEVKAAVDYMAAAGK